ncbi:Mth938-like domain-containing protein [uncultured Massilia sp.]|uniref:Mth938-like domain-containing protein n=1 Tax=uncultured Massilia sp. TaxID=169973 RepID=UPI0025ED641A|nr:Mth938-like domain-containing protein [uncultured Massilia sp.]
MKLHSSSTEKYQTVTGYDQSGVEINAKRFDYSVLVMPEVAPRPWDVASFEELTAAHFEAIAADKPDVVVLGTGERQRFVHPRLVASLSDLRIGVESMDSHAACRTYNILMGEGRKVTLALIIEGKKAPA